MARDASISSAFEKRRGEVERVGNAQAQVFRVTGEIEVDGAGEATVSVAFPVLFVDKPDYSFGPELGPGQPIIAGQLPECTMTVLQWNERIRDDGTIIYAGATFGAVTYGLPTQVMIVQWHMEGVALRGPTPNE
jgi:hypothetical protein